MESIAYHKNHRKIYILLFSINNSPLPFSVSFLLYNNNPFFLSFKVLCNKNALSCVFNYFSLPWTQKTISIIRLL